MSAALVARTCPVWCTDHSQHSDMHRTGAVATTEHGVSIHLAQWADDDDPPRLYACMWTPGGDALFDSPNEMRAAAAAMLTAADEFERIAGQP